MDKNAKAPKKAKPKQPATVPGGQQGWPAQNSAAGIKGASTGHDRKAMGRGSARGR